MYNSGYVGGDYKNSVTMVNGRDIDEDPEVSATAYLGADLSSVTSATINQLRQAFQIQKLLEKTHEAARDTARYCASTSGLSLLTLVCRFRSIWADTDCLSTYLRLSRPLRLTARVRWATQRR